MTCPRLRASVARGHHCTGVSLSPNLQCGSWFDPVAQSHTSYLPSRWAAGCWQEGVGAADVSQEAGPQDIWVSPPALPATQTSTSGRLRTTVLSSLRSGGHRSETGVRAGHAPWGRALPPPPAPDDARSAWVMSQLCFHLHCSSRPCASLSSWGLLMRTPAVGFRTKPNLNPINLQGPCFQIRLRPQGLGAHLAGLVGGSVLKARAFKYGCQLEDMAHRDGLLPLPARPSCSARSCPPAPGEGRPRVALRYTAGVPAAQRDQEPKQRQRKGSGTRAEGPRSFRRERAGIEARSRTLLLRSQHLEASREGTGGGAWTGRTERPRSRDKVPGTGRAAQGPGAGKRAAVLAGGRGGTSQRRRDSGPPVHADGALPATHSPYSQRRLTASHRRPSGGTSGV